MDKLFSALIGAQWQPSRTLLRTDFESPGKANQLILLANSDAQHAVKLAEGDVMRSAFASLFMRLFVFEYIHRATLPEPKWKLDQKSLAAEIARLEKQAKEYKYDRALAAPDSIRLWLADRQESARKQIKLDPKVFDAYVGQYQVDSGAAWTITSEQGKLVRQGSVLKIKLSLSQRPNSSLNFQRRNTLS